MLALPTPARAVPSHWVYIENLEDGTPGMAAPAPSQAAPHAAGSLNLGGALSATSSVSSCSAVNLAVGTTEKGGPTGISDGMGGAIIAFEDFQSDPARSAIYAKHVLACGALDPTWPAGGVLISGAAGGYGPVTVTDGSDGAIIIWERTPIGSTDFSNVDIYAQHLSGAGMIDPSWPANGAGVCTDPGQQIFPHVTSDGAGGAFVTWNDSRFGASQRTSRCA
jgi:hypothetical protein